MTITDIQMEFILEHYFKNDTHYVGWRAIAEKLIKDGTCIVAGDECIWKGGIGNYITTEKDDGFFHCMTYKFDLYYFISSAWFKEVYEEYLKVITPEYEAAKKKFDEINNIKKW